MKQATFENGNGLDRNIIIRISDDYIEFFFEKDYYRHLEWVKKQEEDHQEIDDEQREPIEFYGFEKYRWKHPREDFPAHMGIKNWFTNEMLNFINANT